MNGKPWSRFQSETSVFKFLWRSEVRQLRNLTIKKHKTENSDIKDESFVRIFIDVKSAWNASFKIG